MISLSSSLFLLLEISDTDWTLSRGSALCTAENDCRGNTAPEKGLIMEFYLSLRRDCFSRFVLLGLLFFPLLLYETLNSSSSMRWFQ